jgi:Acetyltransferases
MEFVFEKEISQKVIDEVYNLAKEYTKDFFTANFPDDMRVDMEFQRALYISEEGRIVSCIVYTCLDGSIHITMMLTDCRCAGKGYGTKLMTEFEKHVSKYGIQSIELYTFSPETRPVYSSTIEFYEKNGFKIVGKHKDLWEKGAVTLKMRKSW